MPIKPVMILEKINRYDSFPIFTNARTANTVSTATAHSVKTAVTSGMPKIEAPRF